MASVTAVAYGVSAEIVLMLYTCQQGFFILLERGYSVPCDTA